MALLPRLSQLHTLLCFFSADALRCSESLVFPSKLTHLTLSVERGSTTASIDAVLAVASRLPLLRSFLLRLPKADSKVSYAPFVSMPQLEQFGFRWPELCLHLPSDAQLHEMRSMAHVTALRFDILPNALLHSLCRAPLPPFATNVRSLGDWVRVDAELSALLNIPLMLTELTRVDRSLLWQLVLSFEYWWLIANRLAEAATGLALSAVGAHGSADSSEWTSDVLPNPLAQLLSR